MRPTEHESLIVSARRLRSEAVNDEGGLPDELRRIVSDFLDAVDPEALQDARRALDAKGGVERGRRYFELIGELVKASPPFVTGRTVEERQTELRGLFQHAEGLWQDAALLYERKRFATAKFLAIACLEEVGKLGIANLQALLPDRELKSLAAQRLPRPLTSHAKKHFLIAGQGAFINARLDRVLGIERIRGFLDRAESGEIERERQAALYVDVGPAGPSTPEEVVLQPDSAFYVALAGECLAEVLGTWPDEWERLLALVHEFEVRAGMVAAGPDETVEGASA